MKFDDIRVGDRLRVERTDDVVIEFTVTEISDDTYVWTGDDLFLSRGGMESGSEKVTLLERTAKYHSMYRVWLDPVDPPVYAILRKGRDGDVFMYGDPEQLNTVLRVPVDQVERYEVAQ